MYKSDSKAISFNTPSEVNYKHIVCSKAKLVIYNRYAFVYHRTSREAKYNLRRTTDLKLLGPECHVEYANRSLSLFNSNTILNSRKVVINRIPYNVTEDDIHHLFPTCRILKYSPARIINCTKKTKHTMDKQKILPGYEQLFLKKINLCINFS